MKRQPSTPEQIDDAIAAGPVRWVYVADWWPAGDRTMNRGWEQVAPAHAVIRALHTEAEAYLRLLDETRDDLRRCRERVAELESALRVIRDVPEFVTAVKELDR